MRKAALATIAAVLAFSGTVEAQSTSASLTGIVVNGSGAPVPDAVVLARSDDNGAVRNDVTDERGRYRIDLLSPGMWTVVAQHGDGVVSESHTVQLALQQTLRLDLTVGEGLRERVQVVAEAPLLDPGRTGGELRIGGDQTDNLPIAGRSVTELALLEAKVETAADGNFYGERGSVFVINGQSGRSNSFLVDGLDNNDQTSGTSLNSFFSQQVIREFVVMTHQYSPEFGRASGGVMNIVTRRGGNRPAGQVFVQGTVRGWGEPGPLVESLPSSGVGGDDTAGGVQYGFRSGGPFRKDRAFYFVALERQDNEEIVSWQGLNRDRSLGGWTAGPGESTNLFLRTDFNLGPSHVLMFRASLDEREIHEVNVGGRFGPEFGFRIEERDVQFAASLTSVISANLLNEARVLAGTSDFDQFGNSDRPGVDRPTGVFGGNNLNRQLRSEDRIQLIDNFTWQLAVHSLKLGFDVTRSRTSIRTAFNPAGNFLYRTDDPFDSGDCGNIDATDINPIDPREPVPCVGIPNFDDNGDGRIDEPALPYTYPLVLQYVFGEPDATLDDTLYAVFAQDSWKIGPRWQLDYGLRYDLGTFTLPEEARVQSSIPNGGAGRDWNNVAPRIGFTFTPGAGKTVLRGGAGVFYDKLVLAFPAVAAVTSQTEIGFLPLQGVGGEVDEVFVEAFIEQVGLEAYRQALEDAAFFNPELILRFSTATELDTPYSVQFSLGVDRAVGTNGIASVNVTRALGYHLPLMRDLNPVVALDCVDGAERPVAECAAGVPIHRDRDTGSIAAITTEGRSWYTGIDLGWKWRHPRHWLSATYTWSRAEDLGPDPLKGGIYLPPNSDDITLERGRSDSDRRHRFVLAGGTRLSWQDLGLSGVVRLYSGLPFNVTTGLDENFDGINTDRPPGVGRNSGKDTPIEVVNLIRADEGLAPVGSLEEDAFAQVDVRVAKPFRAAERDGWNGEVFVQVFNLFNRYNPGPAQGRITARTFGEPVGYAGPPRTIQLGLKISY